MKVSPRLAIRLLLLSSLSFLPLAPLVAGVPGSVHLEASAAVPGQPWSLFLYSTPDSPFRLLATSPSRHEFELASGTTDSGGFTEILLELADLPGIQGQDLRVRAEVTDGANVLSSGPKYFQLLPAGENPEAAFLDSSLGVFASLEATEILVAGDFDGDGRDDLLAFGVREELPVLLLTRRDEAGELELVEDIGISPGSLTAVRDVAFGDVDLDGDLDLVLATDERDTTHHLYLNDGTGQFTHSGGMPEKGSSGLRAISVLLADLDGDGAPDLYFSTGISEAHDTGEPLPQPDELLRNDGSGNFTPDTAFFESTELNPPGLTRAALAADVDLDGVVDLLLARAGNNRILPGDGSGGFLDGLDRLPLAEETTRDLAVADVDLDGDLDLVLVNSVFSPFAQTLLINQGGAQEGEFGFFEGSAFGQFPSAVEGQSPVRLGLLVTDVDADGDSDVIFTTHELGSSEPPDLYLNQGGRQGGTPGEFRLSGGFPLPAGVYGQAAATDLDDDGDLDLLLPMTSTFNPVDSPVMVHRVESLLFDGPNPPLAYRSGEVNQDGLHDLSDAIAILSHLFLGDPRLACPLAGDINGDGNLDISDPIAQLLYLFLDGAPPAGPFPEWGDASISSDLPCESLRILEG